MPLLAWLVPLCALRLQPHKRLPKASPSVPTWLDPESPAAPAHGKTPGGLPRWGQTLTPREMLSPPRSVYPPWDGSPCPLGLGQNWNPHCSLHKKNHGDHSLHICKKATWSVPHRVFPAAGAAAPACAHWACHVSLRISQLLCNLELLLNPPGRTMNFKQFGSKSRKHRSLLGGTCQIAHLRGAHTAVGILYPLNIEGKGVICVAAFGS